MKVFQCVPLPGYHLSFPTLDTTERKNPGLRPGFLLLTANLFRHYYRIFTIRVAVVWVVFFGASADSVIARGVALAVTLCEVLASFGFTEARAVAVGLWLATIPVRPLCIDVMPMALPVVWLACLA